MFYKPKKGVFSNKRLALIPAQSIRGVKHVVERSLDVHFLASVVCKRSEMEILSEE